MWTPAAVITLIHELQETMALGTMCLAYLVAIGTFAYHGPPITTEAFAWLTGIGLALVAYGRYKASLVSRKEKSLTTSRETDT